MTYTYLQLVNMVLRRLRETEAATLQGSGRTNSYPRLIGDFINEAKAQVEAAWDWSALRNTMTVTTSSGVFNYTLTGSGNKFEVLNVLNDTDNWFMEYRDSTWFDSRFRLNPIVNGSPAYYNFNGVASNGDTQVDIWPVPDKAYDLRFNVVKRTTELAADADLLYIPHRPVMLLATAMAIEERGEDGAEQSMNAYAAAKSALSDEIALDGARHPEELIWREV